MIADFTPDQQAIVDAAPSFFRIRSPEDHDYSPWDQRGFEIRPGWYGIVRDMAVAIEAVTLEARCEQVKQKFGGLRCYFSAPREHRFAIEAIVSRSAARALVTCELCGNDGGLDEYRQWIRVRCAGCRGGP